jgi:SEC-C motif
MNEAKAVQIPDFPRVEDRDELLSRYRRLRAVGTQLNNQLVSQLGKGVLEEGGKKLGIYKSGTFVFDSEDEMSILMDYCIYNVYRNGRNALDRFLLDSPPPQDSDEMRCLEARQRAFYSLFAVESVIAGLGVIARDLRADNVILVVDQGFGNTAEPGVVFASRIFVHEDFTMTGGASLPLGVVPEKEHAEFAKTMLTLSSSLEKGFIDPAPLIRACLRRGASSHVRYEDATGTMPRPHIGPSHGKPGRNSACPCGSGKKYKQCCLKKVRW